MKVEFSIFLIFGTFWPMSFALRCHVCPNDTFGANGCTVEDATLQLCGPPVGNDSISSDSNSKYRCLHTPHKDIFQLAVIRAIGFLQQSRDLSSSGSRPFGAATTPPPSPVDFSSCLALLRRTSAQLAQPSQRNTKYVFQCDASDVCRTGDITTWVLDNIVARPECSNVANIFNEFRIRRMAQTGVLCCDFDGCNGKQYWVQRVGDLVLQEYAAGASGAMRPFGDAPAATTTTSRNAKSTTTLLKSTKITASGARPFDVTTTTTTKTITRTSRIAKKSIKNQAPNNNVNV